MPWASVLVLVLGLILLTAACVSSHGLRTPAVAVVAVRVTMTVATRPSPIRAIAPVGLLLNDIQNSVRQRRVELESLLNRSQ